MQCGMCNVKFGIVTLTITLNFADTDFLKTACAVLSVIFGGANLVINFLRYRKMN